jgi:transposase
MGQLLDLIVNSLPGWELLMLDRVDETGDDIVIRVSALAEPSCPSCSGSAVSYHSQYHRLLRDLSWQGRKVQIRLRTRRFRCHNEACLAEIFSEQIRGVAVRYARETSRLAQVIRSVGYAMGGLPGARLLETIGVKTSDDTVLRRIKEQPWRTEDKVRVLGVDDWAWRKRQRYGTLLMDLERKRVIDLLPVRSAASFAEWLFAHPGVEVLTRDRSRLYAEGGRLGAPGAVQITDRFHLVSNLSEAVEREVQRLQVQVRPEPTTVAPAPAPPTTNVTTPAKPTRVIKWLNWKEARLQRCRQARYQRYLAVMEGGRQGLTQLAIAARVGLGAETVAGWLHAPGFPERRIRSDRRVAVRPSRQEPAGVPASTLPSSPETLAKVVSETSMKVHFSAGRVAALVAQPPRKLAAAPRTFLDDFLCSYPTARPLRRLVNSFRAMLRWHRSERLSAWIEKATTSEFPFVAQYAKALRRELEGIALSITVPWSNGPVEGQINRLKVIKRQMYGRAGFALLRARVLPFEPLVA